MRILLVNKFFYAKGGAERVLFDLLEEYEHAGHETVHFSMQHSRNRPSPWAEFFVEEVDYESVGLLGSVRGALRAVHHRKAAARIADLCRSARPTVAHVHNFHHQLSPSILDALRGAGVPVVHTVHDYKLACPNYLLYTNGDVCERCAPGSYFPAVRHRCVRSSLTASVVAWGEMMRAHRTGSVRDGVAAFACPSRFMAEKIHGAGYPRDRIQVVPNGVDPSAFVPASAPGEGFLYAGRLSREKGLDTLLRAVSRSGVSLTIAGTGPEEDRLRASAAANGLDVHFTGRLTRDDLVARMRASRAVVLPSEWYENGPVSVLEAFASGVGVIGADTGGIPEMVRPHKTGLLFPPGDSDALAESMSALESDPDLAFEMGRNARCVVEEEFSLGRQVRTMLDLLQEVSSSAS
ncbi:MAG: glycosyltransferase [Gemmatimonadota bacterium]|nr:glycosyltransferase [Gemmatimonadota bacterium]MDP6801939.1 glycosyltransferase [Gemmatimonadota bacterium]MDP7032360.1 glycosyltransferase [Gemmatimonadota bacterium]